MSYSDAIARFTKAATVRRCGRVLDAVEGVLVTHDWPDVAAADVTAYVVTEGSGSPGAGWYEVWNMNAEDVPSEVRSSMRPPTLGPEDEQLPVPAPAT